MKPSLRFLRFLAVRDERMMSHAGCRNAYTNTFPPLGPHKKKGKENATCHRDGNRSISANTASKQTQPWTHKLVLTQLPKLSCSCAFFLSLFFTQLYPFSFLCWQSFSSLHNPSLKSFH